MFESKRQINVVAITVRTLTVHVVEYPPLHVVEYPLRCAPLDAGYATPQQYRGNIALEQLQLHAGISTVNNIAAA
jgi:hypothetical protein